MICSETKWSSKLDKIKQLLMENEYFTEVLLSCINQKLPNFVGDKNVWGERNAQYTQTYSELEILYQIFKNQINKAIYLVYML